MTEHDERWEVNRERDGVTTPFVSNFPKKGAIGEALAPVGGFGVTLRNFFKPVVTEQYPYKKTPPMARYHGRHQLNRYADGLGKVHRLRAVRVGVPRGRDLRRGRFEHAGRAVQSR